MQVIAHCLMFAVYSVGSADLGVVIGSVAGALIALALVVTIVIVAAIVVKVFF